MTFLPSVGVVVAEDQTSFATTAAIMLVTSEVPLVQYLHI